MAGANITKCSRYNYDIGFHFCQQYIRYKGNGKI